MSNLPEGLAQFEYQKAQLIGSLGAVADSMRNCAAMADQFAQMIPHLPVGPNGIPAHLNGQYPIAVMPTPAVTGKRKARGDDVDGRKKKTPKDPNAPKRPASSYLLFQNDVRQELKAKHPNLPNNELLGIISKLWSDMPKEQKDAYEKRQKDAKDNWLKQKAIYEHRDDVPAGEDGSTSLPATPTVPIAVPKVIAAATPVVPSSEDEESDEEASTSSSNSDEDDQPPPPPKKSKKEKDADAAAPAKEAGPVKEKKHKKKA